MRDWILLRWEELYLYIHDFWYYEAEDLDTCCRR